MGQVRKHTRRVKNKVVSVRKHFRGKYGPKPKNDKYPPRDAGSMSMETLLKHRDMYQKEFSKLMKGELFSSSRHKAFILRRLKNVQSIINKKQKE